ncbi:MAG: hypothetical protein CXZ00_08545 [Acidobacteria bacterium]|nr:MAG: hypothetical protein CXZ00_08545 [Acidobacteriota bacterium]
MLNRVFHLVLCLAGVAVLAVAAHAECAAPTQSGLIMCFPSKGSTVLYPATIELAANSGGVAITHLSVYDGNVKVDSLDFLPGKLVDFAIKNGFHSITVNAWDANGKLYQAKSSFTVTGFGVGVCARGGSTITLCSPSAGSYQPETGVPISAAFAVGVKRWTVTLDGKALISSAQTGQPASAPLQTGAFAPAGSHTLVISAVNAQGVTSTLTRRFYTFYNLDCNPKTGACRPGITVVSPSGMGESLAADVGTSFRVQAEVTGNPKPITKMIVYLNGVKVQQSAGPGITAEVNTTKGSHFIVILAWDTAGKLYETYGNVNVN